MPKIKQDDAQEKALALVASKLTIIQNLNQAIASPAESSYTLSVKNEGARAVNVSIMDKNVEKIKAILAAQKKVLVKETNALCEKYRIELSEEEKATLG